MRSKIQLVDTGTERRLAVEADADPRSVRKVLRGGSVRGIVDARIREVLAAHGLTPAAPSEGGSP